MAGIEKTKDPCSEAGAEMDAGTQLAPVCIAVTVVYALAERQVELALQVAAGSTAREVACSCGLEAFFPELVAENVALGVYGELVQDDYCLQTGDRLELYRELLLDPMELRRKRAAG